MNASNYTRPFSASTKRINRVDQIDQALDRLGDADASAASVTSTICASSMMRMTMTHSWEARST